MQTELNKNLEDYFKITKLEDINIEGIKNFFPNINIANEYGGLLHGAVHEKFDEHKTLKFIEILLDNKIDPNIRGNNTGYNYIQLALYGYTDNGQDYSYSTEFIVNLIELGKKYNFDIQSYDNDKDSIVHTALASEIFTGDTIAVLDALGQDFDLECVDNKNHNVYEALKYYQEEAKLIDNKTWFDRLNACENELKRRIEISQYKPDEVNKEIERLKRNLEETKNQDIKIIITDYKKIISLEDTLTELLEKKANFTGKKEQSNLIKEINTSIELKAMNYLKEISKNPNNSQFQELNEVLQAFNFQEIITFLKELQSTYEKSIEKVKISFKEATNLEELQTSKKQLEKFSEEKVIFELTSLFEEKISHFNELVTNIKDLFRTLTTINKALSEEDEPLKRLEKMTMTELEFEKEFLNNKINEKMILIKDRICKKTVNLINEVLLFASNDLLCEDEIFELLTTTIKQKRMKNNKKVKVIKNVNK